MELTHSLELALEFRKEKFLDCWDLNGAGKTTIIDILTSHIPSSSGSVHFRDPYHAAEFMGVCPQNSPVCNKKTVQEHLMMIATIKGLTSQLAKEQVDALLEYIRMKEYQDKYAETLSGGNKRKLLIAMTLMARVKILILDEPTAGIDPLSRRAIWKLCANIASQQGTSIILTSSVLDEAERLCGKIGFLVHGQLQASGSPRELREYWVTGFRLSVDLNQPK